MKRLAILPLSIVVAAATAAATGACVARISVGSFDAADASPDASAGADASATPSQNKLEAIASSTCAIAGNRTVKCWGDNSNGTLGNGADITTATQSSTPVAVVGAVANVASVGGGSYVQCAVDVAGEAKCWGACLFGTIGPGSFVSASTSTPTSMGQFGFGSGAASATAGLNYVCILSGTARARCAGSNGSGQLGDGTTTDQASAVDVTGIAEGIAAVSAAQAGVSTCAVTTTGGVKCWGSNAMGQLGNGTTSDSPAPTDVSGLLSGVTSIGVGDTHACALTTAGAVLCWGDNSQGQVGDGTTSARPTPVTTIPSGAVALTAGASHSCALTSDGHVSCWGDGNPSPSVVSGLPTDIDFVSAGASHTCVMRHDGSVMCWGDNSFGQLGDGTTNSSSVPVSTVGLP